MKKKKHVQNYILKATFWYKLPLMMSMETTMQKLTYWHNAPFSSD